MALNQSHAANGTGIVLFYGESMPFVNMREVDIKQPVFGPNRIEGKVIAEATGGWQGEALFSLVFKRGGAIEFGKTLLELGRRASAAGRDFRPPPYQPSYDMNGAAQYYACPPPAYSSPYGDPYFGFVQSHETFTTPDAHTLYQVGAPPPYPGAGPQPMPPNQWGTGQQPPNQWGTGQQPPNQWGTGQQPPNQWGTGQQPPNQWGAAPQPPMSTPYNTGTAPQAGSGYGYGYNQNADMSASHAAKAQEAEASANQSTNHVAGGYYFPNDPHTVYAQPSAPPADSNAPSYSDVCGPPPAYTPQILDRNRTDDKTKKNQ